MKLVTVLKDIPYFLIMGEPNQEVDSIIYDSRIKTASGLFIAIKGFSTDGHQYIGAAIENGAKTIVVEDHVEIQKEGITVVKVDNTRTIMARLAVNFYDHPSTKLDLVGVTGTNGKTSITFLLGQLLEAYNKKTGIIGTIENRIGRTILKSQHTTPESADLQKLLETMVEEGVSHCLMEVSSHALALHRVDENDFKIGIFTNLTQDHLDFHKTMDAYAEAKAILFSRCQVGVLNEDSSYVHKMKEKATCEIITYGIDNLADYHASQIHVTAQGVTYHLSTPEGAYQVEVPIPGKFTVYNTLAVICTARQLGLPMEFI
ncbi:MAG: UDP-N-acetylmuramoyl-L-alanyl-D-glutamate--2,6-diaminopimelate ligase, partial [Niameybacter sp.]